MADFTSRFNELLARSTDSDASIAYALGVSKQTISAWKNGVRFPKRPVVRIIAEHFNVGIPWLIGMTDDERAGLDVSQPDPTEQELVAIYRDLNDTGRTALMGTARGLAMNPDMKKGWRVEHRNGLICLKRL